MAQILEPNGYKSVKFAATKVDKACATFDQKFNKTIETNSVGRYYPAVWLTDDQMWMLHFFVHNGIAVRHANQMPRQHWLDRMTDNHDAKA